MDLRIHSPGTVGFFSAGGVDPGPAFVRLACVKGLDIVAVTDYNNAAYIDTLKEVAAPSKLTVVPGVDLRCRVDLCDEVFLICLFPEDSSSASIFRVLRELGIPEDAHGSPDYCVEQDIAKVIKTVEKRGGVIIPSRLDKTPFRQLAIATLIEDFGFHAFDLVYPDNTDFFRQHWPRGEFTFFCFSNAHSLAQVGSRIERVKLERPGFDGIKARVARRKATGRSSSFRSRLV